ncbi:S8 family peptidase [Hyphomonas sp.]|uniref:S8 family peptidase n=1 Tax=Hyphomonas sp. TaxID=87 RepID=UPI00391A0BC7
MFRQLTARSTRAAMAALLAGGALLVACDRIEERLGRAREVADASVGQISGETIVDPGQRNLARAAPLDRAIAGTVMAQFAVDEEETPLFAIGSIIAKPRELVDDEEAAGGIWEDDYFDETSEEDLSGDPGAPVAGAPVVEGTAPRTIEELRPALRQAEIATPENLRRIRIDPRDMQETRQEVARAARDLEQIAIEAPGDMVQQRRIQRSEIRALEPEAQEEVLKLARRAPVTRQAVRRQLDANEVMLETMSRYGMGGEVQLSRQGQMVIQLGTDGASPTQFRGRAAAAEFLARADQVDCPENASIETIRADLALATACMVRDLQDSGQFEYVERDYIFQNQFARRPPESQPGTPGASRPPQAGTPAAPQPASFLPNDPLWALQWHFRDRGTADGRAPGGAGFESFWQRQGTAGSRDVVVAVVDTGIQKDHPDIAGSPNIMPGWDMVSDPRMGNDGDGRDPDPTDPGDMCDPTRPGAADSFHGTHVAGTIGAAATNNGSGVAGGAWNVRIVPVRALGKCGGRLSDINDAIRWAAGLIPAEHPDGREVWNENPAHIINLSIGLLGACPASLQDAIDSAAAEGVLVVAAAGNARLPTSFYAPAGCRNVITVAAADARGHITPYSNFGPEVMLLAPGGDLTRDDNGDGKPDGVLSTKRATDCFDPVTGEGVENCYYAYEQGTSMAAPHVSAALALLRARDPDARPGDLVSKLMSSVDPRSTLQCASPCSQYPGTTPLPDDPEMCSRPCGSGLLNLANVPVPPANSGSR